MTVPETGATEEAGGGTGDAATIAITAMTDRGIRGGKAEGEGEAEAEVAPPVLREAVVGVTITAGAESSMRILMIARSVTVLLLTYYSAYLVSLVSSSTGPSTAPYKLPPYTERRAKRYPVDKKPTYVVCH